MLGPKRTKCAQPIGVRARQAFPRIELARTRIMAYPRSRSLTWIRELRVSLSEVTLNHFVPRSPSILIVVLVFDLVRTANVRLKKPR